MKLKNILMTGAIALVGAASANAAMTYNAGDLILGFGSASSTYSYEIDLGSYTKLTSSFTYQVSTSDLATAFGTSWTTWDGTISFGVIGAGSSSTSVIGSGATQKAAGTTWVTDTATPNYLRGATNQKTAATQIITVTGGQTGAGSNGAYTTGVASSNDSKATLISVSSGDNSFFTRFVGSPNATYGSTAVSSLASGQSSVSMNEYEMTGSLSSGYNVPASPIGTFSLSNTGTLSYQAVPEPSTYAMLGLGGLGLLGMIRRRRA